MNTNEFHITACATLDAQSNSSFSVEHELRLAKIAYLYADKVTLYTPVATLMDAARVLSSLTHEQLIALIEKITRDTTTPGAYEAIIKFCMANRGLHNLRSARVNIIPLESELHSLMDIAFDDLRDKCGELSNELKLDEFDSLLKTNILTIEGLGEKLSPLDSAAAIINGRSSSEIDTYLQRLVSDLIQAMEAAITSSQSYPLFDSFGSTFLRIILEAGIINPSSVQVKKAKSVGLAADILNRLPMFEQATASEIIDIRASLDKYLVNFRSAMINFSKETESAAWDKDFTSEVDLVFREKVEPAIMHIENEVKSNNLLNKIAYGIITRPEAPTVLGASLVPHFHIPEIATAALAISSFSGATAKALSDWKETQRGIDRNQMFFYYGAASRLKSGQT